MALLVKKFGGTSVATVERIQHVAEKIIACKQAGDNVVVVLSAMAGETDRLINLAKQITPSPSPREYDFLISTGEQVSVALLSIALSTRGYEAKAHTGRGAGIITDQQFNKARIKQIDSKVLQQDISQGLIPIVTGFQGMTDEGEVTTLGRGGSDTTAVAIAAALAADECQIYTDVDGIYTADPRIVPDARRMSTITFEEILEMASLGAKVLQIRAVEFAGKYKVPLRVLSSFKDGDGTLISLDDKDMESPVIAGVTHSKNEARISLVGMKDVSQAMANVLNLISDANIDIDMIVKNKARANIVNFSFSLNSDDYPKAVALLEPRLEEFGITKIIGDDKLAKVSIVGVGMRSHPGIAATMFSALAEEGIEVELVTTSEIKITVAINEQYMKRAVNILHNVFKLSSD